MEVIYALENMPIALQKSIYLAGPSPRDAAHPNWRQEALRLLADAGYDGHVFVPLPRDGSHSEDYLIQADWEQRAMNHSDILLFWVPRDLVTLPGFSTNVEFGQKVAGRNIVLGHPAEAPKCRFLDYLAENHHVSVHHSLADTLSDALEQLSDGAERSGGECQVPLFLWNTRHFQHWLQAQKRAGNRLDGCTVKLAFGVGPREAFLLYWGVHVDIHVAREGRNKSNEIAIGRPDVKHVVGFQRAAEWRDSLIILIREFRSTAVVGDCLVREVPGGSSFKDQSPLETAAQEFAEETGIDINPERLRPLAVRQVAATATTHCAHVYAVALSDEEISNARRKQAEAIVHGRVEESERTYVEVYTLGELLDQPWTDWANLGMIVNAIAAEESSPLAATQTQQQPQQDPLPV